MKLTDRTRSIIIRALKEERDMSRIVHDDELVKEITNIIADLNKTKVKE